MSRHTGLNNSPIITEKLGSKLWSMLWIHRAFSVTLSEVWRWRKQTYSKSKFNMESYFSSSTPAGGGKPPIDICQRQKTGGGTSGPASSGRSFLSFCGSSKGKHRPKFSLSSVNPEFSSWRGLLLLSSVLPLFCINCWWSDWRVGGAHKAEQYK